jgi:transcriptional regulator with XRE-family HTH domain
MAANKAHIVDLEAASMDGRSQRLAGTRTRKKVEKRIGWIAGMDANELERSGSALLAMLLAAATHKQLQLQDLALKLGVTYSYLAQLRSGYRQVVNVSEDFLTRAAEFLEVPRMAVLLASGRVKLSDFYATPHIEDKIEPALRFIQADGELGAAMPATVFMQDKDIQLFIIDLYQKATHRNLLGQPVSYQEMNEYAALSVPISDEPSATPSKQ